MIEYTLDVLDSGLTIGNEMLGEVVVFLTVAGIRISCVMLVIYITIKLWTQK